MTGPAPASRSPSAGKYQSFFCRNAVSGIKGCSNRGYKSARIIDDAVLKVVSAVIFTEEFTASLTAAKAIVSRPESTTTARQCRDGGPCSSWPGWLPRQK